MTTIADTIRLTKDDSEIVFVFGSKTANVQVHEDGAVASWRYDWATSEIVKRLRYGWTLVPVAAE